MYSKPARHQHWDNKKNWQLKQIFRDTAMYFDMTKNVDFTNQGLHRQCQSFCHTLFSGHSSASDSG